MDTYGNNHECSKNECVYRSTYLSLYVCRIPPQLIEEWEIARQEVMLEHSTMVSQYRENKSGLQAQLEAGVTFKRSTSKSTPELEFVPVNLHIQQMKVKVEGSEEKGTSSCGSTRGISQ